MDACHSINQLQIREEKLEFDDQDIKFRYLQDYIDVFNKSRLQS